MKLLCQLYPGHILFTAIRAAIIEPATVNSSDSLVFCNPEGMNKFEYPKTNEFTIKVKARSRISTLATMCGGLETTARFIRDLDGIDNLPFINGDLGNSVDCIWPGPLSD